MPHLASFPSQVNRSPNALHRTRPTHYGSIDKREEDIPTLIYCLLLYYCFHIYIFTSMWLSFLSPFSLCFTFGSAASRHRTCSKLDGSWMTVNIIQRLLPIVLQYTGLSQNGNIWHIRMGCHHNSRTQSLLVWNIQMLIYSNKIAKYLCLEVRCQDTKLEPFVSWFLSPDTSKTHDDHNSCI